MHHQTCIDNLIKHGIATYPKLLQREDFQDNFPEILHLQITSKVEKKDIEQYLISNWGDEILQEAQSASVELIHDKSYDFHMSTLKLLDKMS